jgi:hypothetical protein
VTGDALLPAYIALIRLELKLAAGDDALAELRARLSPDAASEQPPPRAPGMMRLQAALSELELGRSPAAGLEQFANDLIFLQVFAPDGEPMEDAALERLLRDVMDSGQGPTHSSRTKGRVLPIERRASEQERDT